MESLSYCKNVWNMDFHSLLFYDEDKRIKAGMSITISPILQETAGYEYSLHNWRNLQGIVRFELVFICHLWKLLFTFSVFL